MKTVRNLFRWHLLGVIGAWIIASGGASLAPAAEDDSHTLPPSRPGTQGEMGQYYLGRYYRYAMFPGRLVCLRCDSMPTPENMEVCRKEGHRHALAMEGDAMVHPLIFTSEDLFTKINAQGWHRKKVQVWGRYYADTGYIVVGDIQAMDEGEQQGGKSNSAAGEDK